MAIKTAVPLSVHAEFLTRREVAARFGVAPQTITRWANEGILPAVRTLHGQRRYPADVVANYTAVPDDAIAQLASSVRMYSGQAMVHTSGALGAEALAPAMAAGTQVGAFHPLVAFAEHAGAGDPRGELGRRKLRRNT